MTLLFGCRQPDMDHIYKKEMEEMKRRGVLKEVYTAYSRQPGQAKVRLAPLVFEGWLLSEWSSRLRFGLCVSLFFKKMAAFCFSVLSTSDKRPHSFKRSHRLNDTVTLGVSFG